MRPGEEAELQINRDGETRTLTVTLGARGESMTASSDDRSESNGPSSAEALQEELGLQLQDVTPDMARRLGLDEAQGVVITGVDQSNRMIRESGLQPRQIIFKMAGEQISDMGTFMEVYRGVEPGDAFRMAVRNPDGFVFVTSLRRPADTE
jgi:hypothetical protein